MDRRQFIQRSVLGLGAASCPSLWGVSPTAGEKKRPNILFLFTDDQSFRTIHGLNNPEVKTPNFDRLVRQGVTFTHCFNQGAWHGAICVASRAMLNTGRYLWSSGGDTCGDYPLWGQTLGRAGYETYITGKWHNGPQALARGFKQVGPTAGGMLPSRAIKPKAGESGGRLVDPYDRPRPGNEWSPSDESLQGHWQPTDGKTIHSSQLWADQAIWFLGTAAQSSANPFFMYVAFHAPHDPRQSPREFVDMYPPESLTIPPNFLPEHPFDQGDNRVRDELLAPFPRTEAAVRVHLSEYYAIITHVDYQIGRILDALEASGQAGNTLIIFSADNGLAMGQHGLMGKQNPYDHSIRIPLVMSGPGLPAGKKNDALVYLASLFATTCDLAGVAVPETVQFPSLAPLLRGETTRLHDSIYNGYRDLQRVVRTERYKLIRYPKAREVQLFDLQADPWERFDLAEKPEYQPIVRELDGKLRDWMQTTGDTLRLEPL